MHSHAAVDSTRQRNSVSTNQLMRRQPASAPNLQGLRRLAPSATCGEDAQPTVLLYATSTLEGPRSWTRSTRHGATGYSARAAHPSRSVAAPAVSQLMQESRVYGSTLPAWRGDFRGLTLKAMHCGVLVAGRISSRKLTAALGHTCLPVTDEGRATPSHSPSMHTLEGPGLERHAPGFKQRQPGNPSPTARMAA